MARFYPKELLQRAVKDSLQQLQETGVADPDYTVKVAHQDHYTFKVTLSCAGRDDVTFLVAVRNEKKY